ncbi:MAG: PTS galactosamine/N-acetylgalactosamine transporter subunit IIA [Anaerorhabdus sp.]
MIGMILTGHGNFASGLNSAITLITGKQENFEVVDFVQEHSVEDLSNNLLKAIDNLKECSDILVFTDLVGGSPFKTAVEVSMKTESKLTVLGGTNLGMLIECAMARGFMDNPDDLVNIALNTGKDQVIKYEFKKREEDKVEDGI